MVAHTDAGEAVLVRQFRVASEANSLEIPGGMVEVGRSRPQAAARELLEETGTRAREPVFLGAVHPNPALQTNRRHSYLALGAQWAAAQAQDTGEDIEVVHFPANALQRLVREGVIDPCPGGDGRRFRRAGRGAVRPLHPALSAKPGGALGRTASMKLLSVALAFCLVVAVFFV